MSTISILGIEEANTCAKNKHETLLMETADWLGINLKCISPQEPKFNGLVEVFIPQQRKQARDHMGELLRLAGARSVEPDQCGFRVVWPGATPWRVVVSQLDLLVAGGGDPSLVAVRDEASACYVVVVPLELFKHIRQDEVCRAADIERRNKLFKRHVGVEFTADDAFVQDLRLHVLRVLQRSLEDSPTARLLKSMGMPMAPATDDELLSDGPSLGQDEEHFLSALDADLHSHWQAVAQ